MLITGVRNRGNSTNAFPSAGILPLVCLDPSAGRLEQYYAFVLCQDIQGSLVNYRLASKVYVVTRHPVRMPYINDRPPGRVALNKEMHAV